jgi:hypothetical protein
LKSFSFGCPALLCFTNIEEKNTEMSSNADAAGGNSAGQVIPNAGALGQANPGFAGQVNLGGGAGGQVQPSGNFLFGQATPGIAGQAIPGGTGGQIVPPNVSTMALIKFRALLKDVPQDSLAEATVLLTECLLEQAHVPKPPHWNTLPPRPFWQWREEAELLGAQFVPAAAGGPLPQQVRVIVDEVTTLFRVAAQSGQQGDNKEYKDNNRVNWSSFPSRRKNVPKSSSRYPEERVTRRNVSP